MMSHISFNLHALFLFYLLTFIFSLAPSCIIKAVGSTPAGLQYLVTKSMLQASKALNLSLYLLLKADQSSINSKATPTVESSNDESFLMEDNANDIQSHPVMERLNQLSQLTDKLRKNVEDKTPGLEKQMHSLVKAAALMKGENVESSDESSTHDETDVEEDVGSDEDLDAKIDVNVASGQNSVSSSDSENEESDALIQRRILTEAKFALRNQDIKTEASKAAKKNNPSLVPPSSVDYGDDAEEASERVLEAGRKLASTMNSIAQKSSTNNGKKTQHISVEDDDNEYERLQRGLAMIDEEFGMGSDKEDEMSKEAEDEGFEDEEDDDFYRQIKSKSKAKKEAKKQMYDVAPKYPRIEGEIEGENIVSHLSLIQGSCLTLHIFFNQVNVLLEEQ